MKYKLCKINFYFEFKDKIIMKLLETVFIKRKKQFNTSIR